MRLKRLYFALLLLFIAFLYSRFLPYEGLIHILSQPKPVLAPDAGCTLANQIIAANTNRAVGDCPAGDGLDFIEITEDILLQEPLPKISADIIVEGNGHTISGGKKHRIFLVQDANLTIRDLTMTEGNAEEGGAILTLYGSKVHIVDSVISNSEAQNGGAIYNRVGTLSLTDSTIIHNRAQEFGGGIVSKATLSVKRSSFVDNAAHVGGAIYVRSSGSHISDSTFSGNRAVSTGGALFFDNSRSMDLVHVTVTGNPPHHPLEAKSHAIGAGNPSLCTHSDQLGTERPAGKCDIGAFQSAG